MEENIFSIQNVQFQDILSYERIDIPRGKCTFLTGKSGTGKSTLFKLLNKTLKYSSGSIYYKAKNISYIDTLQLRKQVILIGQDVFLFEETVANNFRNYFDFRDLQVPSRQEMTSYLNMMCIDVDLNKDCNLLSGGEKQRVFLAIHLAFKPEVLLFDEPISALDSETSHKVIQNLIAYCREQNITPIIISHNDEINEGYAENTIELGACS